MLIIEPKAIMSGYNRRHRFMTANHVNHWANSNHGREVTRRQTLKVTVKQLQI